MHYSLFCGLYRPFLSPNYVHDHYMHIIKLLLCSHQPMVIVVTMKWRICFTLFENIHIKNLRNFFRMNQFENVFFWRLKSILKRFIKIVFRPNRTVYQYGVSIEHADMQNFIWHFNGTVVYFCVSIHLIASKNADAIWTIDVIYRRFVAVVWVSFAKSTMHQLHWNVLLILDKLNINWLRVIQSSPTSFCDRHSFQIFSDKLPKKDEKCFLS